jgi:outer membrane protein TolC
MNKYLIEAGRMARVEIVQTEADVAARRFELTEAENALDAARLALLQVLDIEKRTQIVPAERPEALPVDLAVKEFQKTALENRPDYIQSLISLDIREMELKVAENRRLWDLSLDGSWGNTGEDVHHRKHALGKSQNTNRGEWEVGMSLTIPIGDYTREQGVVRAETNLKKARLELVEQKENIEIEVLDAVRDVEAKLRQVELARQARELSERKLDIEQEKLKAGRSSNFQLVTFQNDLVRAQNNELNAKINYLNALTTLDKVLGTTLDTWKIVFAENGT